MNRILVGLCHCLEACSGGVIYRDLAEPVTVDDYEPLPSQVTKQNARLVVRKCLQGHRRSSATLDAEYGYAFRDAGFVQLYHFRTLDREQERISRSYVDFGALSGASVEPSYNLMRLKQEFRVVLCGRFRKWESAIRSFLPQPDLDIEPSAVELNSLILMLDDPVVAKRLTEALTVFSSR
jgi:hypothetical protein